MNSDERGIAHFGPFTLNIAERSLSKDGSIIPLGARALDILVNLASRSGTIVNRHQLMDLVWRDVTVEEANLRAQMTTLRRALGDGEDGNRYIVNVPGQGYSFVSHVTWSGERDLREIQADEPTQSNQRPPSPIENLIGRADTISHLMRRLQADRFVTVVGAGGIGKTTVAVVLADLFLKSGSVVYFVDLSTVQDPADISPAIASVLECPMIGPDADFAIVSFLAARHALLVLDNCEHVLGSAARIAVRILGASPNVSLLATSREPLRASGETVHILPPLDSPAESNLPASEALKFSAVELFMERAASSGFDAPLSDDDAPFVAELCRRMDGIALAIELAASRVGSFGIRGTAELISAGTELSVPNRRGVSPRHQTLQAMVEWSVNLLSEADRRFLLNLSAFVGPFTLEGAAAVAADGQYRRENVSLIIASLVEKSLVFVVQAHGNIFYRLLETTRAYATSALPAGEESVRTNHRHAVHYMEFFSTVSTQVATNARGTASFTPHLGNLSKALTWSFSHSGDAAIAVNLVANAAYVLMQLSRFNECYRWCSRALEVLPSDQAGSLLELRLSEALASSAMYSLGNRDETKELLEKALEQAEKLNDGRRQLNMLSELNFLYARRSDTQAGLKTAQRIKFIADKLGVVEDQVAAEIMLAVGCHHAGDQAGALLHCQAGFQIAEDGGRVQLDLITDARGRFMFAKALWLNGFPDQALNVGRKKMKEMGEYTHHISFCIGLTYSIALFVWSGNFNEAESVCEALLTHADKNAVADFHSIGQAFKGWLYVETERSEEGTELLRRSLQALHGQEYYTLTPMIQCSLAKGLSDLGQFDEAEATMEQAINTAYRFGDFKTLPDLLRTHGEILRARPGNDLAKAEAQFRSSMLEARRQSAIGWELKAAIQLANMLHGVQRDDEAHDVLRTVYERFTEGFDTADLVMAETVLRQTQKTEHRA
ncbi:Transcriptional regulator, winged helix family [Neorhizobium galegae bv. orientalis]|nr:Transcriptional regulator, winged helix family [Neorhizobium galegae bv. orientalis]